MPVLDVRHLNVRIPTEDGVIHAVRDVSFTVEAGDFFGVVGESGSGKSVMVLVPGAEITGEAFFNGRDLLLMKPEELRQIRGKSISMIFQDPLSSLHPQFTIGWQITEQIHTHTRVSRAAAKARAIEILGKVGIPDPAVRFDAYPHQFSGGMRQRVMIAMALVLNPALIIADEPTTALDSTVQAQLPELLDEIQKEFDATILMITHDLSVLARVANRMMVMYAGHRLEIGPAREVFAAPAHPYSAGLLRSSPANSRPGVALVPISGRLPSLLDPVQADSAEAVVDQHRQRRRQDSPPSDRGVDPVADRCRAAFLRRAAPMRCRSAGANDPRFVSTTTGWRRAAGSPMLHRNR